MGEACETCGREKGTSLNDIDAYKKCRGGVTCWQRGYDRSQAALAAARRECEAELRNQRNRIEKCAQLFAEIRGDWTDPRDMCREGRQLCMDALADIDAALAGPAAGEEGRRNG